MKGLSVYYIYTGFPNFQINKISDLFSIVSTPKNLFSFPQKCWRDAIRIVQSCDTLKSSNKKGERSIISDKMFNLFVFPNLYTEFHNFPGLKCTFEIPCFPAMGILYVVFDILTYNVFFNKRFICLPNYVQNKLFTILNSP